jgi:hypothetical protein
MTALIVGYLPHDRGRPGAGLRLRDDGGIELSEQGSPWREIGRLTAEESERAAELTRAAGIPDLPDEVPRPEGLDGGSDCEWWTDLDGRPRRSVIHGWTDDNPAAVPSRKLVMDLYPLVAAAQARA